MTIERTVDIPESRQLTLEVPAEIPAGRTTLTLTFTAAPEEPHTGALADGDTLPTALTAFEELPPSYSPEAAIQRAAELRADPTHRPITDFIGSCPGFLGGDGLAYQRSVRGEWDD